MTGGYSGFERDPGVLATTAELEYDVLRPVVMDQARDIRQALAAQGTATLLKPDSSLVEGALASFDEAFISPDDQRIPRGEIVAHGIDIRLMDWDERWCCSSLQIKGDALAERPIGVYYAYLGADMQPLGKSRFRFGILPEKDRIETASSFYLWGSPYHKPRVDAEDLAYISLLFKDAQEPQRLPADSHPQASSSLASIVRGLLRR